MFVRNPKDIVALTDTKGIVALTDTLGLCLDACNLKVYVDVKPQACPVLQWYTLPDTYSSTNPAGCLCLCLLR